MRKITENLIDINDLINKNVIELEGKGAKLTIIKKNSYYLVEFFCNLENDLDTTVSIILDLNRRGLLYKLKDIFKESTIFQFYDPKDNVGLEVGIEIDKEAEIYFSVVDYSYDATTNNLPNYLSINITSDMKNYDVFDELFKILYDILSKKLESDYSEHKPDNPEHQRKSRL